MSAQYSDLQLDALRELANVGSGNASTALSAMLGRSVDIDVPNAFVLPMGEAVESIGSAEDDVTGIVLGVFGDMEATVLLLVTPNHAALLCGMLGVPADSEYGESALMEIGNIVGSSYINALAMMTGMSIEPTPPSIATDMLAAIVESVLATRAGRGDSAARLPWSSRTRTVRVVPARPRPGGVEQLLAGL